MEIVKLGDVCTVIAGQSPVGSSYNTDGDGIEFHQGKKLFGDLVIQKSNIFTDAPTKIAEAGDILMSVRAPVGPVNHLDRKICIGRGLAAIRAGERLDKSYLFYYLRMTESLITGRAGATFASINRSEISALTLPLPSIEEQKRIVKKLDSSFERIDKAIELSDLKTNYLIALKKSMLNEVFSEKSVE